MKYYNIKCNNKVDCMLIVDLKAFVSLWENAATRTKKEELKTVCIWAAGFYHVMTNFLLSKHLETYGYFFNFHFFF